MRRNTIILVRISLAGLFGLALVSKLSAPSTLLDPLRVGLGLPDRAAALVFVLAVLALAACIGTLLLRPGPLGLFLSGAFFLTGAMYAVVLNRHGWTGPCGCGVAPIAELANPLTTHAYQNTACAVLSFFLAFRARARGDHTHEQENEAFLQA
ncbi:MAG: hypothetical protein LAT64_09600 [Phycisphaerales bacterium]|nr:hypothetical protein [Planctomycetota bacterium]MCH8509002.1 hypothetical protein [Phycisphaerales bacterium]